jgi:hypothetical protein
MFKPIIDYLHEIIDKIPINYIFYGETFAKPKHNCLAYTNMPKNHFALFAVEHSILDFSNGQQFSSHEHLVTFADDLGIDVAPLLFKGKTDNPLELLQSLMNTKSYLGGVNIEGLVIKNLHKACLISNITFPITCAKMVCEEFKEVHKHSTSPTKKDQLSLLRAKYNVPARWLKSLQHLRENGEIENTARDIGKLCAAIKKDVWEECQDMIKEDLFNLFGKDILNHTHHGVAEWYKKKLINNSGDEA